MRRIISVVTLILSLSYSLYGDIPYELEYRISSIPLSKDSYSIYIKGLDSGQEIASWNTYRAMKPASVIKLLTTYAGVLGLGFDYRWETKFFHSGYIKNGTLHGNLIIKASGDPTLKSRDIPSIVDNIQSLGIRKILGDIVIDRTIFQVPWQNSSRFDKNRYSPYNAMPDAMMFNERKSTLCVTPKGRGVRLNRVDNDRSYRVVNRLKVVNRSCKSGYSWPKVTIKTDANQRSTIFLSGKLSKRCGTRKICKVVSMPHRAFYYALKSEIGRRGIKFLGTLKLRRVSKRDRYIFSHFSPTLEEVLPIILKRSNNLVARQLFLTIGTTYYQPPINTLKASTAVKRLLKHRHILADDYTIIQNGSGLSRVSRVSTKTLANLLEDAYFNYGYRWLDSLSIAGIDGTIRRRFQNSSVYGRAWMKTGTIKSVANIAGYVEGISGEKFVVIVLVNSPKSSQYGRELANRVIEWVGDNL
uniref:D-alanyl-D-alanine carboxypeptidase/D-alanyl-D-alanine-endopeptidase n=1 Tax=Alvinella pompejana epibiont 6C6 TaxID=244799 RepID=Q6W3N7_9BACT|nr:D-alanyl-D-alanine carboxypeptidase/D-alanyl-D-alanine-endopeptidase [Alvinella pompejana epibiont 6C6]